MSWQRVDKLLPKEAKDLSTRAQVAGSQVCRLWEEYAGKLFLARTMKNHEAINFRDGVLTVAVESSLVAAELKAYEYRIVGQINRALDKDLVRTVNYR